MIKIIFSHFLLILMISPCFSQSHIGLSLGMDFADIDAHNPVEDNQRFVVYEKDYAVESVFFGIKGQHHLSKLFSVSLMFFFTNKEISANPKIGSFIGFKSVSYKSLQSNILFSYHFINNWQIGTGLTMRYIYGATETTSPTNSEGPWQEFKEKREMGFIISPGYRYKNILAEIYYNKSITPARKNEYDFKPIDSFGISLSYLFQVAKGKR